MMKRQTRGVEPPKKKTSRAFKGNRPLADSRINRSGLSRGAVAPPFRLPTPAGGEVALEAYRGRRLLLVFSDPKCGPCRELMPELEALHQRTPDIEVLVISRGNVEAVKAEFAEHPASFPVAVQKRWEISRRYAMFATPVGYLIDEAGVIASDVSSGAEAILVLLASAQILALLKSVKKLQNSFKAKLAKANHAGEAKLEKRHG
jgi:peroxiredoxin